MAEVERGEIPVEVAASEVPELLTYFRERLSAYSEEERAKILSAADVSNSVNEAPVQEADHRSVEKRLLAETIGPVCIEKHRVRSISLEE